MALIERTGAASVVVTDTRPEMLVAVPARMPDPAGTITVSVPPARVHLFNAETGAALPA